MERVGREHFGAHLKRAAAVDGSADDVRPIPEVDSATYYKVWSTHSKAC